MSSGESPTGPPTPVSPFFKRVYGAYTPRQFEYILQVLGDSPCKIVDPMSGAGWYLPKLVAMGHRVTAFDINPVVSALVNLRKYRSSREISGIRHHLDNVLRRCPGTGRTRAQRYEAGWLPENVAGWLERYGNEVREEESIELGAQEATETAKILYDLPLLAARRFATFTQSDNATWVKPGGLHNGCDPGQSIIYAFHEWQRYLETTYASVDRIGSLATEIFDVCRRRTRSRFDRVVFSPPYANRMDYVRMWAPEASVYRAVLADDPFALAPQVIGTNIVKGVHIDRSDLADLPLIARRALRAIKSDTNKASASYYFPFFANYAVRLHLAIQCAGALLRKGGVGVVFLRDTPRKDIMFPSGPIAKAALQHAGCEVTDETTHIIRGHIGMRRRREHTSLQGLAQREWWLRFERPR